MKICLRVIMSGLVLAVLNGCGGGGNGGDGGVGKPITDSYVFPAGKATLVFSAMSTAKLAASVSGIDFTITLPQGMSVATTGGLSGPIESSWVTPGSSLSGTNLAFGSYSASSGKTRLGMATTSNSYRSGEFLRLVCTVAPNTSITLGNLKAQNSPVMVLKAVGYDSVTKSTLTLTNNVMVTLGAVK